MLHDVILNVWYDLYRKFKDGLLPQDDTIEDLMFALNSGPIDIRTASDEVKKIVDERLKINLNQQITKKLNDYRMVLEFAFSQSDYNLKKTLEAAYKNVIQCPSDLNEEIDKDARVRSYTPDPINGLYQLMSILFRMYEIEMKEIRRGDIPQSILTTNTEYLHYFIKILR